VRLRNCNVKLFGVKKFIPVRVCERGWKWRGGVIFYLRNYSVKKRILNNRRKIQYRCILHKDCRNLEWADNISGSCAIWGGLVDPWRNH